MGGLHLQDDRRSPLFMSVYTYTIQYVLVGLLAALAQKGGFRVGGGGGGSFYVSACITDLINFCAMRALDE